MKFNCLQQDLLPSLQAVSRSVGAHSTLPVLDNILLSLEGNKLKIAATNLEIGIFKFVNVEGAVSGEVTVPAKTIVEIITNLGPNKVEIESEEENLTITSAKFKATINGIAASEYPVIPLSAEKEIKFPKEVFLSSAQILYAAAVDEGRPVLTGILTEVKEGSLNLVATDGFRLAHRQASLPSKQPAFKTLIPKRTLEEVLRVIAESEVEEVGISTSSNQNQIIFSVGSTIVSSRLIEGTFPVWEKIIPTEISCRVMVDKEEILRALKLAAVFAKNEANIITLTTKKEGLSLSSSAKELGSQENQIEAQVEGEDLQIAFNARFLQDAISNCPATQMMMEFSGALSPTLIKPIGVEGLEFIVMPVRLS